MTNARRGVLKRTQMHVGPNMTPMVDVVMCILIFFMLGTSLAVPELFLKSHTAAIDKGGLGSEQGTQKLPAVRMDIKLSRVGTGAGGTTMVQVFDGAAMPLSREGDANQAATEAIYAKMAARRKTISDEMQVLIVPAKDVPTQDFVTIFAECTKLEFKQVGFYPAK